MSFPVCYGCPEVDGAHVHNLSGRISTVCAHRDHAEVTTALLEACRAALAAERSVTLAQERELREGLAAKLVAAIVKAGGIP